MKPRICNIHSVEEFVLNPSKLPEEMFDKDGIPWRYYRLEYMSTNEAYSIIETSIWLPPKTDIRELEEWLNKQLKECYGLGSRR